MWANAKNNKWLKEMKETVKFKSEREEPEVCFKQLLHLDKGGP